MTLTLFAAVSLAVMSAGLAHAELTIWQVENNPLGTDAGHEWLTLINTGPHGTFSGYSLETTHGRTASHVVPTIYLGACEHYRITFPGQAVDNRDDTVRLLRNGIVIYETPVIEDTHNDGRFWKNPGVAYACGGQREDGSVVHGQPADIEKDLRIMELEAENAVLKAEAEKDLRIMELEAENAMLKAGGAGADADGAGAEAGKAEPSVVFKLLEDVASSIIGALDWLLGVR